MITAHKVIWPTGRGREFLLMIDIVCLCRFHISVHDLTLNFLDTRKPVSLLSDNANLRKIVVGHVPKSNKLFS